eukprot:11562852-Heterocapsa_arctica.AAC.1
MKPDERAQPRRQLFKLRDAIKTGCEEIGTSFHRLMKEVASMSKENRESVSQSAGGTPTLLHANDFGR